MKKLATGYGVLYSVLIGLLLVMIGVSTAIDSMVNPSAATLDTGVEEILETTTSAKTDVKEPLEQLPLEVEFGEAQREGLIEYSAYGQGYSNQIQMSLTSRSDDRLEIAILPGTIFEPLAADIQSSMVVVAQRVISLDPHETVSLFYVDAARVSMLLDAPGDVDSLFDGDSLLLSMIPATGDLMKLLNLPDFQDETAVVQQFAIWTITDDPVRDEYRAIDHSGLGSGPSDEEIERIRLLFEKADILTSNYWVLEKLVFVELREAESKGLLEVNIYGTGSISLVLMTLTSKSDDSLEIAILPGTILESQSASVHDMVIVGGDLVGLHPYRTFGPLGISALSINMNLDSPGESDRLVLSVFPPGGELMPLLNLPEFYDFSRRLQQFAIWTITDNPGRDEYLPLFAPFSRVGFGPSDMDIIVIRDLFEKAGILVDKYRALD